MLYGKTIVVTGAASGIGEHTAALASSLGAEVIGIDIRQPRVPLSAFIEADLSSLPSIEQLVGRLPANIDALCNIAGLSGKVGAARTLAVNFFGLRALSERVAPLIRHGGAIVNAASIAGFGWRMNLERAKNLVGVQGFPDMPTLVHEFGIKDEECYPVSKEVLLLWTLRAAHDERFRKRDIRVNSVSPGPVHTPILQEFRTVLGDARVDSDIDRVGRAGRSADIAPAILFLCSDGARWINGANLPVDGGLEATINAEVLGF